MNLGAFIFKMARVNRSSVLLWIQETLGIQSGVNSIPVELANNIQPIFDIQPKVSTVLKSGARSSTGSSTIYTTPADKDFFLTFVTLTLTKDATCDNTLTSVSVVNGGATTNLAIITSQTLTAYTNQIVVNLSYPLKVDRNTAIQLSATFTAGTLSTRTTLGGFIVE